MTLTAYPSKLSADLLEVRLEGHPLPRPQQVLKLESQSDSVQEIVFCEVISVSLLESKSGETTCKVALKVLNGSPDLAPLKATILNQSELAKAANCLLIPVQHPMQLGSKDASEPPVDFFRLGPLSILEGGSDLSVRISALMQILRGIQPYQRVLLIDPIGVVMSSDSASHIRAGQHGSLALQQVSGKRFLEVFAETLPEFLQEAGLRTVASILPQSFRGNKNAFIGFQSLMALETLTEAPLRNLILQTLYTLMDAKVFAEKPEEVLSFKKGLPSPITILDISMLPAPWKGFFYAEICQRALQEVAGELVLALVHPEIYLPDWHKWIQQACEEELNYVVVPSPFRASMGSSSSQVSDWKTSANNVFALSNDGKSLTLKGDLTLGLPVWYAVNTDALMPSLSASPSQASVSAWQTPFDSDEAASAEMLPDYPSELRQALASQQEQSVSDDDEEQDSPLEYHMYRDEKDYGDAEDDFEDDIDSEDETLDDDDSDEVEGDFDEEADFESEEDEPSEASEDDDLTADDDTGVEELDSDSFAEDDEGESESYYSSYLGGQESLYKPPAPQPLAEADSHISAPESTPSNDPQSSFIDVNADDSNSDLPDEFNFNMALLPDDPDFEKQSSSQNYQQEPQSSYLQETAYTEKAQSSIGEEQSPSANQQSTQIQRYSEPPSFENYDDDFGDEESGDFDFDFDATLYEPSWLTPASNWQPSPSPRAARQAHYSEEESYSAPSRQEMEAYRPAPAPDEASASQDESGYYSDSDYSNDEDNEDAYTEQPPMSEAESSPDEEIPVLTRNTTAPKVPEGYFVGERIRHPQYGLGTVTKILPMADQVILNITFDQVGKRLLDPSLCDLTREGGEK